ncbi:MAG: bifunctional 5,10-methylenetetrahydrofolate dehydrogenase/5,10-methenyltetrahydrofolate cyclohydrolase [Candidatus Nealsonbacteria bacterium]|nr:bifunctional 5,10-methylenetetrahydrofolate dehydrogenase/5,10-methenyltetrahydrofolate cyclohydrolase [Candidatus Nealsonbacteria bacterium]
MRIFNGKKEAEKILLDLGKRISKEKLKPKLAVILVGEDKASRLYIKLKRKAAKKISIKLVLYKFKEATVEEKIIQKIKTLNNNSSIHGIIVQLPLPKKFNQNKIVGAVNPKKDVDGFQKNGWFLPVLPSAILFTIKKAMKTSFKKKKVVALVNSKIFGQRLKSFFKKEGIELDYILRKKHSFTELPREASSKNIHSSRPFAATRVDEEEDFISSTFENKNKLKRADIIITVLGSPNAIWGDMIKKKAILIDAGISKIAAKKVVGDVNRESVKEKAAFLTPVPGGIGPLTVALLLKNVYYAAKYSQVN